MALKESEASTWLVFVLVFWDSNEADWGTCSPRRPPCPRRSEVGGMSPRPPVPPWFALMDMWIYGVAGKVRSRWYMPKNILSFWFVWIERKAVQTEPRMQSGKARFKVGDGGAIICTFETNVNLTIISALLKRNAVARNYLVNRWNIQWAKNWCKYGALWHARQTSGWFKRNRANADSLCAVCEIRCQPSKCGAFHTTASWESWVWNGRWY